MAFEALSKFRLPKDLSRSVEIITKSYLSNRKQFVSVNNSDSNTMEVAYRVPQGSGVHFGLTIFHNLYQ